MNRLVIIGNGFDLAHGLPTSYKDFIEDYFVNCLNSFFENNIYEDKLISIKHKMSGYSMLDTPKVDSIEGFFSYIKQQSHYVSLHFKSEFFNIINKKIETLKWVDIENEYFEELKKCINSNRYLNTKKLETLNTEFNFIKVKLENYLSKTIKSSKTPISPNKYSRIFSDFIYKEEVLLADLVENKLPDNILVLNFNYTSTVENSVNSIKTIPTEINYIHGILDFNENPIIFGFGDEYDEDFRGFENLKNNSLFEHIKSFNYFKTPNYHNLIKFLEADDYQVYIVGHSCGLSDRTMLKEIFENQKCKSIKIFFYEKADGTNDFVEKTMEISRHFEDKGLMRKKIVPFPQSKKM
ncbi:AbiH family protein [uncultured Flavobacterium sp.]|uniref:AbiH family protein n=1 Tax=uncultured Flavobacterium sp. TaxID=165435 RepID=UPI0030EC1377|tara:strand:- start:63978 stop:65033 length:1056 start_codon:yes stop_codon:yes gene_type:complete